MARYSYSRTRSRSARRGVGMTTLLDVQLEEIVGDNDGDDNEDDDDDNDDDDGHDGDVMKSCNHIIEDIEGRLDYLESNARNWDRWCVCVCVCVCLCV